MNIFEAHQDKVFFPSKATKATKKEIYCLWIFEAFVALLKRFAFAIVFSAAWRFGCEITGCY